MKRLLSAVLVLFITFLLVPLPASAAGHITCTLTPSAVEVSPGDVFTLSLSCWSDIELQTYESWVNYDGDVFEVLEIIGYDDVTTLLDPYPDTLVWGMYVEEGSIFQGGLGYVKLRVRESAETGTYVFSHITRAFRPESIESEPSEGNAVTINVVRKLCGQNGSHNYVKSVEKNHPHEIYYICTKCGDQYKDGEEFVIGCSDCEDWLRHDYTYTYKDENYHEKVYDFDSSQKELEKHGWYENSVGKPATCKETGTITYTCICEGTKTEIIPKKAHILEEKWSTDETQHWNMCTECDERGNVEKHTFSNLCDPDCDVCGYTRENPHTLLNDWQNDKENHWYSCSVCLEKLHQEPHTFSDENDICTVCGYGEDYQTETAPSATQPTASIPNVESAPSKSAPKNSGNDMTIHYVIIGCAILLLIGCTILMITQIRAAKSEEQAENDGKE